MRCYWCGTEQPEEPPVHPNTGRRCRDGAACAERAGELTWGAYPGMPLPAPGRYCCLDLGCSHPREQVFNGGGG